MGRRQAERAAAVWCWRTKRRRPVSEWQLLEKDGGRAGPAERRAGEGVWILFYWPPSHHCHGHCSKG